MHPVHGSRRAWDAALACRVLVPRAWPTEVKQPTDRPSNTAVRMTLGGEPISSIKVGRSGLFRTKRGSWQG